MQDIKSLEKSWRMLFIQLARINQSETYFTFNRSFPTKNPKWVPIL